MATYNRRGIIRGSLESIKNQTYRDYEVIVINDGGEDVVDIVKEVGLNDFKYISYSKNRGLFSAFNIGLKNISGDFVTFLDDDDIFFPNAISDMLGGFVNEDVRAVYAKCRRIRGDLNGRVEIFPEKDELQDINRIRTRNWMVDSARMVRKEVIDVLKGFDEEFVYLGDWDFNIRCALNFGFEFVDKVVTEVNMHDNSRSLINRFSERRIGEAKIIEEKYKKE